MKTLARISFVLLFALATVVCSFADNSTNYPAPVTARDYYNNGTRLLDSGKFSEAEGMFVSALGAQNESIQPKTLYNLGHARFADGLELLKKGPDAQKASAQGRQALSDANNVLAFSESAIAQNDLNRMISAYIAGRGARRELKQAQKAVQAAMETYGNTLNKWQRAADDFKGAAELNPADTNAIRNAEIVEQAIAKLVDSLRQMQEMAGALGDKKSQLDKMLGKLKGQIPAPNAPPGGFGDDDEDDDGIQPSELAGQKEGASREGEQMQVPFSPDQAGQLLDGLLPDGTRRLPMSDQQGSKPKEKTGRNW